MRMDLDRWEEIGVTITRNKTRSLLTAFGVFWGIFMLIVLMGGSEGMKDMLSANFEGFATNSGFLVTNETGKAYKGFRKGRYWELVNADVEKVRRSVPEIDVVSPNLARWGVGAVCGENRTSVTLKGLYPEYARIEEQRLSEGRFINDTDIRDYRKVCVIGKRVYESLFPQAGNACGAFIAIDSIYYQVVGVSMATGNVSVQGQSETSIIIPFSTMQRNYNFGQQVQMLAYTALPGFSVSEIEKKVEQVVKRAHTVHPDDKQAVIKVNAEAMFSMVDSLFTGINWLSRLVGLGTLLAGVVGVSNIMMVTVRERTAEIGIRRAIGARPRDILVQILSESVVLTLLAGMAGVCLGVFVLNLLEMGTAAGGSPTHFQISFWGAIGAVCMLMVLGVLAGLAPAYRAMAIRPVEAMRDE